MKKLLSAIRKYYLLILIFIIFLVLRTYDFEARSQFTYDQVDNAWVSKNMIIDQKYPLLGMTARQNSGVSIGPAYYYYVAFFYWITNLDPIASPIAALVSSTVTFFVLYFVTKKIFSERVALLSIFIYSVAYYAIHFDRIQWPVDFIPLVSLLIFYSLYKIVMGNAKYILLLAFVLGFSLHVHFTSIFYFPIILFTLPLFPKKKTTLISIVAAIPLFAIWLIPIIIASTQNKYNSFSVVSFLQNSYIGVHLRRIIQVAADAFIEYEGILYFKFLSLLKYIILPLFIGYEWIFNRNSNSLKRMYLILLWFLVPWIGMSVYGGDISNYFFTLTRPLVIITISYLLIKIFDIPSIVPKAVVAVSLVLFAYVNIKAYDSEKVEGLAYFKKKGYSQVMHSAGNEFTYGSAESYMYYYYSRKIYKWK